ncbi:MAG: tRNA lysidine(34) synthetase TilS [Bdellovibrionota bacterium]
MLEHRFAQTIRKLYPKRPPKHILVACSGGLDSMVLLNLTHNFCRHAVEKDYKLSACYLDHGQRNDTSVDKKTVASFCKKAKIPFYSRKLKLEANAPEQELREARYLALTEIAQKKLDGATVFTAHHAQDDLETLLFRLIRGADPTTIKGIAPKTQTSTKLSLTRPLLEFSKQDLYDYAVKKNIRWHEDTTNQSLVFARNRIRHELIPWLEGFRPGACERIYSFFGELQKQRPDAVRAAASPKKIAKVSERLVSGKGSTVKSVRFEVLKNSVDRLLGAQNSQRTTKAHWQALKLQLEQRQATRRGGGSQKTIQFPGGNALFFKGTRLFWISNSLQVSKTNP